MEPFVMKFFTRVVPVLLATSALGACATVSDGQTGLSGSSTQLSQPVEAPPVQNPQMPGVAAIVWEFRDGRVAMCGVTQDKGAAMTPDNITTKYALLTDGGYSYQTVKDDVPVSVRINGSDVYGTQDNGKQGKLSDSQAQLFATGFIAQRQACGNMIKTTRDVLAPAAGQAVRPGLVITLGGTSEVKQVTVIGTPKPSAAAAPPAPAG